jgi:hypothetical protein
MSLDRCAGRSRHFAWHTAFCDLRRRGYSAQATGRVGYQFLLRGLLLGGFLHVAALAFDGLQQTCSPGLGGDQRRLLRSDIGRARAGRLRSQSRSAAPKIRSQVVLRSPDSAVTSRHWTPWQISGTPSTCFRSLTTLPGVWPCPVGTRLLRPPDRLIP